MGRRDDAPLLRRFEEMGTGYCERDSATQALSLSISLSDPTGRYQLTVQTGCPCTVGGIRTFIGRKSKTISAKNGSKMSRDAYEKKKKDA